MIAVVEAAIDVVTVANASRVIATLPATVREVVVERFHELSSRPTLEGSFDFTSYGCFAIAEVRKRHYVDVTYPAIRSWLSDDSE